MITTPAATPGITFHHNGDFSGDVMITIYDSTWWEYKNGPVYEHVDSGLEQHHVIRIPFEDLKVLVARYVRQQEIRRLEEATPDDVLTR